MAWQNADGIYVEFPQDITRNVKRVNVPKMVRTAGAYDELVVDLDFVKLSAWGNNFTADLNNDGTYDGFMATDAYLPNNSHIISVRLIATEAATGGTSFTVGLRKIDGTTLSLDTGLVTATEGVIANINAIGKVINGAGSLTSATSGTAGVGTADAFVYVVPTGTYTAGKGRLVITYLAAGADAVG